jgi:hypothetical protein
MKVYGIKIDKIRSTLKYKLGLSEMEQLIILGPMGLADMKFRYQDLINYGLIEDDIQELSIRGFFREYEVGGRESRSIGCQHRYRMDKGYRDRLERMRKKSNKARMPEERRELVSVARKKRMESINTRRKELVKRVIFPKFGVPFDYNTYLPEKLSPVIVLYECNNHPYICQFYGNMRDPYDAVRRDLKSLGIGSTGRSGEGVSFSKRIGFEKMDPDKRKEFISEATTKLLEWHKIRGRNPDLAKEAHRQAVGTRRRKSEENVLYRSRIRKSITAWNEQGSLRKRKRHDFLLGTVINPAFGSPSKITWRDLKRYVSSNGLLSRYLERCPEGSSLDNILRNDLYEIRKGLNNKLI